MSACFHITIRWWFLDVFHVMKVKANCKPNSIYFSMQLIVFWNLKTKLELWKRLDMRKKELNVLHLEKRQKLQNEIRIKDSFKEQTSDIAHWLQFIDNGFNSLSVTSCGTISKTHNGQNYMFQRNLLTLKSDAPVCLGQLRFSYSYRALRYGSHSHHLAHKGVSEWVPSE